METTVKETDLNPKCALCGREVTESDWCYGCQSYICLICFGFPPVSNHKIEDHQSLWE